MAIQPVLVRFVVIILAVLTSNPIEEAMIENLIDLFRRNDRFCLWRDLYLFGSIPSLPETTSFQRGGSGRC